jgi:MFS family permease
MSHGVSAVALPWLVLAGGGSVGVAGIVFTFGTLPYVLLGLPAGVVGDRLRRRRVIYASHAVQTVLAATIPIWSLAAGHPPVALVLVAAFAIGGARVFSDAAAFGAMAAIAGRREFVGAQAALSAAWSIGLFAGPAAGGFLIGVVGPARAILLESVAFAIAAMLVAAIRTPLDAERDLEEVLPPARRALREGIAYIFREPVVRAFTVTSFAWHVSTAGAQALAVPLLRQELALGSVRAGQILGAGSIAALAATATVGVLERRLGPAALASGSMVASAAGIAAMGLVRTELGVLVALCATQAVITVFFTNSIGVRQRHAPDALQARVGISGRMVALTALALGSAAASFLTGPFGLRAVYVAMAVTTLTVALVATPLLRRAAVTSGS